MVVLAVALLVFVLWRATQRQSMQGGERRSMTARWYILLLVGMLGSGGGAALSTTLAPLVGLGVALGGGVLCGVAGWRLIVLRGDHSQD